MMQELFSSANAQLQPMFVLLSISLSFFPISPAVRSVEATRRRKGKEEEEELRHVK